MSARCVECGTPLDEIPFVECAAHRSWAEMEESERFFTHELSARRKIEDLHKRIHALPDFPDEKLELRSILSDIVGMLETNFETKED